jgi:uncharacterized protein YjbI with pentapeptide repeats
LSGIKLLAHSLDGANFVGQNLSGTNFQYSYLNGADFTGANIQGAGFAKEISFSCCGSGSGITPEQLYSTSSYQTGDLRGINFYGNNLAGGNFAGQNLSDASFSFATLVDASFNQANLANANFRDATLTDADFIGADVRGASFQLISFVGGGTGITLAQLYSTASYQAHDLSGISFEGNDLAGGNFSGQYIANSNFVSTSLDGAEFTAADSRGAFFYPDSVDAVITNLIKPDGHIDGLDLGSAGLLVVRDYDGHSLSPQPMPIPITVDEHLAMGPGGTLRMMFEADAWDSTIFFAPDIPVTLGGTLELTFDRPSHPHRHPGAVRFGARRRRPRRPDFMLLAATLPRLPRQTTGHQRLEINHTQKQPGSGRAG